MESSSPKIVCKLFTDVELWEFLGKRWEQTKRRGWLLMDEWADWGRKPEDLQPDRDSTSISAGDREGAGDSPPAGPRRGGGALESPRGSLDVSRLDGKEDESALNRRFLELGVSKAAIDQDHEREP